MSLRLPESLAAEVSVVARADGLSVSRCIREAIEDHVAARRSSDAFQRRLRERVEEDRELLERFAKP